jgi:cytochrome c peroxidase
MEHLASAISFYYSRFSAHLSPFDEAMNDHTMLDEESRHGFNLFMSKAQCATCHFVPQFNGVKPPYIGSEFEVLGVPAQADYKKLSPDSGRHTVNPAFETLRAFRTGTIRNAAKTAPYMHNGVFRNLEELIEFYNRGGGAGRGLNVPNQTLSADSLGLTAAEKKSLIRFIESLNETIPSEAPPTQLPRSSYSALNRRRVGGIY